MKITTRFAPRGREADSSGRRKTTRLIPAVLAAGILLGMSAAAHAQAVITWDASASTTTSETDIQTNGLTNVVGANFGGGTPGSLVANGVTFAFVANNTTTAIGNGISIAPGNWTDAYPNSVLSTMTGNFGTILDNQCGNGPGNFTVDMTLSGLVSGQQYKIQYFASVAVSIPNPFGPVHFKDTAGGSKSPGLVIDNAEQYVGGTFTAVGTTQVIRVNPDLDATAQGPLVSAFVIGELPAAPATPGTLIYGK